LDRRPLSGYFFQRLRAKETLTTNGAFFYLNTESDILFAAALALNITLDATDAA